MRSLCPPLMGEEDPWLCLPASGGRSPARDPLLTACFLPGLLVPLQGGVPGCQARNASYVGRAGGRLPAGGAREQADAPLSSLGTLRAAS